MILGAESVSNAIELIKDIKSLPGNYWRINERYAVLKFSSKPN